MTIQFPDVSNWQGGIDLASWPIISAKATQGRSYVDTFYDDNKAQAARLGVPFIAYHWLDTTDAAEQAAHCFATVGRGVPLMIDDEQNIVDVAHTLAFVRAYRALGGWVRLEYVPQWIWDRSGRPDLRPLADAGLLIVSSNYPSAGYAENGAGWAGYGGIVPTVWQWTSSYPWHGQKIDVNAFRGTAAEFTALLTNGGDDMPTPEEIANAVWARPIGGNDYHDTGDQANGFNAPAAEHLKFVVNDHNFLVALSAKLDKVLTLLEHGGTSGATAQEIAKAVNDDAAARLAD